MPRPPTWEDDAAAEVEGPGGEDVGGGAHGAVAEDAELSVHGDDDRAVEDGVGHLRGRGPPPRAAQAVGFGFVPLRQPAGKVESSRE